MTLLINGEKHTIHHSAITVSDLLALLSITEQKGVAVAKNQNLVRRSEWNDTLLHDGDEIEILHATAGG